ncbi:MAG: DNA cytosine methyltransferase [Dehalococcoidia bacterium]
MGIAAIDLFAGAGGLSIGAVHAGVEVRMLVDFDPMMCRTLELNPEWHPGVVLEHDIATLAGYDLREAAKVGPSDLLLVVGGAPCQPFSKNAYWTDPGDDSRYRKARARGESAPRPVGPVPARPDERRTLVEEYWRIVEESRADAFVFENVPSLLHPRNRHTFDDLNDAAQREGFNTTLFRANAVEFGVPQRRERIFLMGVRGAKPVAPHRTHARTREEVAELSPPTTAGSAIAHLAGDRFFEPEEVVTGRWAQHLREIQPGWNYKWHSAWAGHPNPTFEAERRFWNFLLKLDPEQPSWTIPANPGPWVGPFHWESRRLRTPELAALQCFPRGYRFFGSRRDRVRQIGNAVPATLAKAVIGQVLVAMGESSAARREESAA